MRKQYLTFFLLLFNTVLSAQSPKIGYINIDHIVTSSPQYSQANDRVINKFKPKERHLLLLSNNIQVLVNKFNKNKDGFSQTEIKTEINKITNLERKLKQQALALKKQLALENKKALGKIQNLINKVISKIAKEQGFDLILYQKVAYASKKINITALVSQKLKQQFK
jgi:outer membrane protein